jgi:hypothetical protein
MNRKYPMIVAAVAAAMASGYAGAVIPTLAQASGPTATTLVMAGSSAASSAVGTAIKNDLCGGAANTLSAASKGGSANFLAFSCFTSTAITGLPSNSLVTIYYRTEGGSVVGALPVVSNKQIKRLNLADTTNCTQSGATATCTVTGTTSTSGTTDTWAGAVVADTVQLGVTDVEPGQLTGADFPSNYSAAAFGTATPAQLAALAHKPLFGQIFGLAINKSGESFSTVNLTKQSAANILLGNFSDWSHVPDAVTGNPVSAAPAAITRINREPGSGTRTATNIFFLNYQCGASTSIPPVAGETLNFSTGDELTAANATPGSIAYTSIDQILNPANSTKWTNLVLATIDGVAPTALAAATGSYGFWFEAALVPETGVTGGSLSLSNFLQADLPKLATAPAVPDILVIPGVSGNAATSPPTSNGGTGTTQIFVNPYFRAGNSCNVPGEQI